MRSPTAYGHEYAVNRQDLLIMPLTPPTTTRSPSARRARVAPGTPAVDPGSNVPITVDASKSPNWKKLEFYDRAKKLGIVTATRIRFSATNLTPGYHVFSVLGTDASGTVRTSDPVMVVVQSPQR